ncbi:MAG: acyl-CoA thioesterase [Bacteroidetes bacterium]|nr:acyl-CoA thioesterase [Bacteroidota bacterium]
MKSFETSFRVRYSETDRMGYVYYSRYAEYFEVARVEMLRSMGISYRDLEDSGIILPVVTYSIRFSKPAYYDDLIRVKVSVKCPLKASITFLYESYNEKNELLNEAQVTLAFIDRTTGKPVRAPAAVAEKFY